MCDLQYIVLEKLKDTSTYKKMASFLEYFPQSVWSGNNKRTKDSIKEVVISKFNLGSLPEVSAINEVEPAGQCPNEAAYNAAVGGVPRKWYRKRGAKSQKIH